MQALMMHSTDAAAYDFGGELLKGELNDFELDDIELECSAALLNDPAQTDHLPRRFSMDDAFGSRVFYETALTDFAYHRSSVDGGSHVFSTNGMSPNSKNTPIPTLKPIKDANWTHEEYDFLNDLSHVDQVDLNKNAHPNNKPSKQKLSRKQMKVKPPLFNPALSFLGGQMSSNWTEEECTVFSELSRVCRDEEAEQQQTKPEARHRSMNHVGGKECSAAAKKNPVPSKRKMKAGENRRGSI